MGTLEIQGLVKHFGDRAALSGLDLSVAEGEFFVLLGPSGGGKSTLLQLVCGIEKPDAGRIFLNGREITALPPRERNVGPVFPDYGLYPHMDAYANIAYGLEARGMARDMIDRRVREAADMLGLTPLLQRVIVDLSGGEQQRVALACALAKDADLYLFDEPLSNLDPELRAQARRDIEMVRRAMHKPTLYATHDQTEALAIGDRIGLIAHGQLQQVGTADELSQHPANLFVAGFIGTPSMNLLSATVTYQAAQDEVVAHLASGAALHLPARWKPIVAGLSRPRVVIGLPPAAFHAPGSAAADSWLEGEVEQVEPLIGATMVVLKLAPAVLISALFQGVDESKFEPGGRLKLDVDMEQLCLFDPDTERALTPPA